MAKESQGPWVGVSMESLVQDHNQLCWALFHSLGRDRKREVSPVQMGKTGSTESTSIIAESESYKSTPLESYI